MRSYLISVLFVCLLGGCEKVDTTKLPESPGIDYATIVEELGIEAVVYAGKGGDGELTVLADAGMPDTVQWFRRNLETLNMRPFTEDPRIEGVIIIGNRLSFSAGGRRAASVRYLPVVNEAVKVDLSDGEAELNIPRLVEAVQQAYRH